MISPGDLRGPNHITREQMTELRARFDGLLSPEKAKAVLGDAARDLAMPPIIRINAVVALLDLRLGRSVQSTMARLRRDTGLDAARPTKRGR